MNDENTLSLTTLAHTIHLRTGLPVLIEHTGGGIQTIFAGEPDRDGYYPFAAGPGWIDNGESVASTHDFCWGSDSGGDEECANPDDTDQSVAAKVVAWISAHVTDTEA